MNDLSFEFSFEAWSSGLDCACRLARKEGEGKELVCFSACIPVLCFMLYVKGGRGNK
jgi:hypothetical protein